MKTQNVLMVMILTCGVSVAITYMAMRSPQPAPQPVASEPAPVAPVASTAVQKPEVTQEQVMAIFGSETEARRKKTVDSFIKAMRDLPPFAGSGTRGYPVSVALEGNYDKAQELALKWIQDYPDSADAYYMQAWIFARTGNHDAAVRVCTERLAKGADYSKLRYLLVWVYARQQQYDTALKTCDEALAIEPNLPELYYAKGRILDVLDRHDESLQSYSRAIELNRDYAEAYLFRGLLYTLLGRYEPAIADQKEAIRLNKYEPSGYLGLGMIYDIIGDSQQAVEQMKNAIMLGSLTARTTEAKHPLAAGIGINDALIYTKIGILYLKLGEYDAARAAFRDSIVIGPPTADAYRGLSLAYLMLKEKDAAVENLGILKKLDPQGAVAVEELVNQ